jgi:hypothetical protein
MWSLVVTAVVMSPLARCYCDRSRLLATRLFTYKNSKRRECFRFTLATGRWRHPSIATVILSSNGPGDVNCAHCYYNRVHLSVTQCSNRRGGIVSPSLLWIWSVARHDWGICHYTDWVRMSMTQRSNRHGDIIDPLLLCTFLFCVVRFVDFCWKIVLWCATVWKHSARGRRRPQ